MGIFKIDVVVNGRIGVRDHPGRTAFTKPDVWRSGPATDRPAGLPFNTGRRATAQAPSSAQAARQVVASYEGVVESFDDDGCATTVLEDKNGDRTEVRFYTSVLKERGIEVNSRFTYQVYKTKDGGGFTFLLQKPQELSGAEWDIRRMRARELAELLAEPGQNASQG